MISLQNIQIFGFEFPERRGTAVNIGKI